MPKIEVFINEDLVNKTAIVCLIKPPVDLGLDQHGIILQNQYLQIRGIDNLGVWVYIPKVKRYIIFSDGSKSQEVEFDSSTLVRWDYISSIVVPQTEIKDKEKVLGFKSADKA
jgi:hypothetical protein